MGRLFCLLVFSFCILICSCRSGGDNKDRVHKLLSAALAIEDSDVVTALDLYEEAYSILSEDNNQHAVELMRETHLRLGLLFMRNGLGPESIEELHAVYAIDSAAHDTTKLSYSIRYLAFAHESIGQMSEAQRILSTITDKYVINSANGVLYRNLQTDAYSRYDDLLNAQQRLPDVYKWAATKLTPKGNELMLAVTAWEAEKKGNVARATLSYQKLLEKYSPFMQAFAQLRLMGLQLQANDINAATRSLQDYQATLNLLHERETISRTLLQHHAKFQDRRARHRIETLRKLNQQKTFAIVLIVVIALFAVGFLLLLIRIYRQRQVILLFKIEKLRQWREEWLGQGKEEHVLLTNQLQQTDIFNRLQQKLNGFDKKSVSAEEWEELQKAVNVAYPHFRERLFGLCKLSEHDYHVCLLLKIGTKPSDIARLTSRSDEAISSTRRRLYIRAFDKKAAPSEWDSVIESL